MARRHGIRILLVHGASDALVPAANSRRLAALLPGAEVRVRAGGRAGGMVGGWLGSPCRCRILGQPLKTTPTHPPTHPFTLLLVSQLVVFEGCGHMPHEECPDQFVQTVQTFVAGLDSGSSGSSDGGSGAAEPAASAAERGAPEAA